jgi:REP element-mobilizing transposase RayT
VIDGEMVLNVFWKIVAEEWGRSGEIRAEIELDEYVVMPNHFHAIVNIIENGRGDQSNGTGDHHQSGTGDRPVAPTNHSVTQIANGPRPRSLGALMAGFKSAVTTRINTLRRTPGAPVWQRNYYDRVIRTDREYAQVAAYIANHPANWLKDAERLPEA